MEPILILLVEDNPRDVQLAEEALKESKLHVELSVTNDGEEALKYLYKKEEYAEARTPDLILLDLNLPKVDGREVLKEVKSDPSLKSIPVVVLTTSTAEEDILKSYNLHANCYITKPVDFDKFIEVVQYIHEFWFTIVKLPPKNDET